MYLIYRSNSSYDREIFLHPLGWDTLISPTLNNNSNTRNTHQNTRRPRQLTIFKRELDHYNKFTPEVLNDEGKGEIEIDGKQYFGTPEQIYEQWRVYWMGML